MSTRKHLIVLGGNGYLGQRIVNSALKKGVDVTSVSRSGIAPVGYHLPSNCSSDSKLTWHKGDVFDPSSWVKEIKEREGQSTAVISCIGAFGSNDFMEKINGDANVLSVESAAKAGVDRFVYISAVENNLPDFILKGYFTGKRKAEAAVKEHFYEKGVILRPGFIYGSRDVPLPMSVLGRSTASIPLWVLGKPLEVIFSIPGVDTLRDHIPGMKAILAQPLSVDCVAEVATMAALGETEKESSDKKESLILSIPDIIKQFRLGAANSNKKN